MLNAQIRPDYYTQRYLLILELQAQFVSDIKTLTFQFRINTETATHAKGIPARSSAFLIMNHTIVRAPTFMYSIYPLG